ncbi:MAG: adenylate/guanylate cyclase domain-containing protein, partial [Pseudomonadota bacterium]|nr:adenylate/guanylate cyclase domain-containing protein [Pseudomonadota bacterium]
LGRVMYGNVGTDRRMDMTVTGPAANQVVRLEAATKTAGAAIVASAEFAEACPEPTRPIGRQALRGIPGETALFTLDGLPEG